MPLEEYDYKLRVLVTGTYRSGSTWAYNVARLICAHFGPTYACFHDQYNAQASGPAVHEVIKVHKYLPELIARDTVILTTFREPDDIAASMARLRELGEDDNWTNADRLPVYLAWWGLWNAEAKIRNTRFCLVPFNSIIRAPERQVRYIAESLGFLLMDQTIQEILKKVDNLEIPKRGQDPQTLLRANHITK